MGVATYPLGAGCTLHASYLPKRQRVCQPGSGSSQHDRVLLTQLSLRCALLSPGFLGRREHLRKLLEAGDDDAWEVATVDLADDDNALLVEEVAANMADEDVEDFCDAMNQPEVQAIVQAYTNPSSGPVRGCTGLGVLQHSVSGLLGQRCRCHVMQPLLGALLLHADQCRISWHLHHVQPALQQ